MPGKWVRLGYVGLFLLALIAVFITWSQVGGQGHFDMIPWYWKLSLGLGLAWTVAGAARAAATQERAWNRDTLRWLAAAVAIAAGMGMLVYHYHLLEPVDEDQEMLEEETGVRLPAAALRPGSAWRP